MKIKYLILTSTCWAASSFAGNYPQEEKGLQVLSFDDVRIACQNPAKFHNQSAPSNIQISCKDVQMKWVPHKEGTQSLDTGRVIQTSLISDKYSVSETQTVMPSAAQVVPCARFKEVAETVNTVRTVTCDELISFTGTAADFCSATINSLRAANLNSIQSEDSGRAMSLCSGKMGDLSSQD